MKQKIDNALKEANANMALEGYEITDKENKLAIDYFDGKITLKEVIEKAKQNAEEKKLVNNKI